MKTIESQFVRKLTLLILLFTALCAGAFAQNEFISTWKTDNAGTSTDTEITIPVNDNGGTATVNYDVDWDNDGTFDEFGLTGSVTHDFGVAGTYTIRIQGSLPWIYFNNGGDRLKLLDISQWGNIQWRFFNNSFLGCANLNISATDAPDLSSHNGELVATFSGCTSLTGGLSGWDVSNARNFASMFNGATLFSDDLSSWTPGSNVGGPTNTASMFAGTAFNSDISGWNMSANNRVDGMFFNATAFNQDISSWSFPTSGFLVTTNMFNGATSFDQNIGTWNMSRTWESAGMLANSGMSTANYDATLLGWSALTFAFSPRIPFSAAGLRYCDDTGRAALIAKSWPVGDSGAENTPPVPDAASLSGLSDLCQITSLTAPTATDACTGAVVGTHDQTLPIVTSTTITWTFTDGNGNEATQMQTVTITDATPPVADNASLSDINAVCSVTSLTPPTATDNCAGAVNGTHDATLPITAQGTTVVTWTYTDNNGNQSNQMQNVVINDAIDPVPDAASLSDVNSECPVTSITAPTATDNCAGSVTATPNVTFPITSIGTTVVTWTYDDGNGNSVTQDQNVTLTDTTDPVPDVASLTDIISLADVTSLTAPTATDGCTGSIVGTHDASLPLTRGTYTITWTYADGNGNSVQQSQDAFVGDLTAPIITLTGSASVTVEAGTSYADEGSTATDDVDGNVTASIVTVNPVDPNVPNVYTVTYNVSDAAGNAATEVTRTVTVEDTNAPVITLTGNANEFVFVGGTYIDAGATASDSFEGDLTSSIVTTNPVDVNTPGIYTIQYNVSDAAGNAATEVTRTVEVATLSAPALDFVGDLALDYDYIEVSDNASLDLTSALTFETWVNFNDPITRFNNGYDWQLLMAKSRFHESFGLMLLREPSAGNHILRFYHYGLSAQITDYSWAVSANTWYHIAVTFDGGNTRIFIDGVEVASQAVTGNLVPNNNPFRIGAAPTNGGDPNNTLDPYPLDATLDEVRLWNVAKTVSEINASKDSELKGDETGLVLYYNFNEGAIEGDNTSLSAINDISLQGNDGTLSGFALTGASGNFVSSTLANIATPFSDQTITFDPLADKTFGDADFTVAATASSGLAVNTFSSSNPAVATVSGSTITIVGAGTTEITASQAGDATFRASDATQTLTVNPSPTTISLNLPGTNPTYTGVGQGISPTANDLGGNPTLSTVTEYSLTGENTFSTAAPTGPGVYDVRVNLDAAETNYTAAEVTGTYTIDKATLRVRGQNVAVPVGSVTPPSLSVEYRGFVNGEGTDGATDISGLAGAFNLGSIFPTAPTLDLNTIGFYDINVDVGTAATRNYQLVPDATKGQVNVADNQPILILTDTLKVQVEPGKMAVADLSIGNDGAFGSLTWSAALMDTLGFGSVTSFSKANFASWQLPENQDRITNNVYITRGDNKSIFNARTETTSTNSVSPADTEWSRSGANAATSFSLFHTMHGGNPGSLVGDTATIHLITDDQYHEVVFSSFSGGNTGGGFAYTRTQMHDYITATGTASGTIGTSSAANMQLTFDATNLKSGFNYGQVVLTTNDPANPTVTVITELEVLPAAEAAFSSTVVSDTLTTGDAATMKTLTISNTGPSELNWTLNAPTANRPNEMSNVSVTPASGSILPGASADLTVNFDENQFSVGGTFEWPITIESNDPANPSQEVIVRLVHQGVPNALVATNTTPNPFGNTFVGFTSSATLSISNATGTDTLFVTNIASNEPAFVPETDSMAILPFTQRQLTIQFSPTSAAAFNGNLTFNTDDVNLPLEIIPLSGTGLLPPVIDVTPTMVSGSLTTADTARTQITVNNTGGSDLTWSTAVTAFRSGNAVFFEKLPNADASLAENQDRISPTVWIARNNSRPLFNYNEETAWSTSTATIEWANGKTQDVSAADYTDFRSALNGSVGNNINGATLSLHLKAEDRYFDVEFHSWSNNGSGGGFSYTRTEIIKWAGTSVVEGANNTTMPANNTVFDLEVYGGALFGGTFDGTLNVSSNDPLAPSITVPFTFQVVGGAPDISTTVATSATSAIVNTTGNFNVEIINTGDSTLTVSDITVDNTVFGISETSFTVPAFGSRNVALTFAPTLEQAYNATLSIVSDDAANSPFNVALTGTGLPAPTFQVNALIQDTLAVGVTNAKMMSIMNTTSGDLTWRIAGDVAFEKTNYANPGLEQNQDRISNLVWLTRGDEKPTYNFLESPTYLAAHTSILFGNGTTFSQPTYGTFSDTFNGSADGQVGNTTSLYLVQEDRYFDLAYSSWTSNGNGGGFAYVRREAVPWLEIGNLSGSIAGIGQTDVTATFKSNNLVAGDYEFTYDIETNDPTTPTQTVTFQLHVTGTPDINVTFASDSVRFGDVSLGTTATLPVTIQNLGDSTLTVADIVFDNAVFSVDQTNFTVEPSKNVVVNVSFTPTTLSLYKAGFTITSDDPDEAALQFGVRGTGIDGANLDLDKTTINLEVVAGGFGSDDIILSNSGQQNVNWTFDSKYIAGSEVSFNRPGNVDWMQAQYQDRISDNVWITRKNSGDLFNAFTDNDNFISWADNKTVISGTLPTYNSNHSGAFGGSMSNLAGNTMSLQLTEESRFFDVSFTTWANGGGSGNGSGGAFAYTRRELANWLTTSLAAGTINVGGPNQTLTVSADAANLEAGTYSAELVLGSNGVEPTQTVVVNLTVLGVPQISLPQTSLDFGNLIASNSSTLQVEVTNSGNATLNISDLSIDNAAFTVTNAPIAIEPGNTSQIPISFTADQVQAYAGTLTITSDDTSNPTATVSLSGAGISPPIASVDVTELTESLFFGNSATQTFTIQNTGSTDLAWSLGADQTETVFVKADNADWTLPENQDRISDNLWLTRGNGNGLFNIVVESSDQNRTPGNTEWSLGASSDVTASSYEDLERVPSTRGAIEQVLGQTISLHSINDQQYYDVVFNAFTPEGNSGGGFGYTRKAAIGPEYGAVSFSAHSGVVASGASQQVTVTFNPQANYSGTFELPLQVVSNDPANARIDIPLSLSINGILINTTIADQVVQPGFMSSQFDISGMFTDAQGDPLTINVNSSDPAIVTVAELSNTVTVTEAGATGTSVISITADDGKGTSQTFSFDFRVNATPTVVSAIGNQAYENAFASADFDLSTVFADVDVNDVLSYSVMEDQAGVVGTSISNGILTLTEQGPGTVNVTVTADDGSGGQVSDVFEVFVNKINQTITFNALADVTYGDAAFDPGATASSGLTVSYSSSNTSVATASGSTITIVGAGTTTITASQAGDAAYNAASDIQQSLTVNQASLTATSDDQAKVYGDANPTLTIAYAGFVNGDDATVLDTAPSTATAADATSNVGTYAITASGGADNNYAITHVDGTLTVNQAALTATADDQSKAYGDTNPTLTITYAGFVNGDDESVLDTAPTAATTADAASNVGTYAITASGGVDNNYAITHVDGTLTVNQAALTATADDQTKTYGEANPALTITYAGFVNGEDASILDTAPTVATTADATSNAGSYVITASGGLDINYSIAHVDGTLTVNQAALTATTDDQTKTYGDANPTLTITYVGFVNGDDATALDTAPSAATTADATSNVGTYAITASGGVDNNYVINHVDGTLTVGQATLSVTADDQTKTYGDTNPTLTITYAGFVNGEDASVLDTAPTVATTADATSNAGTYAITASGGVDNNYAITHVNGTLTVGQASITATADDQTKTYGDANPTLTITYAGFVNGEDASVLDTAPTVATTADATSNAGTYAITASGGVDNNYTITHVDGILTVSQAALMATADNQIINEGDALPEFTISYAGFVNGEDASVLGTVPTGSVSITDTNTPGTYAIQVSGGSDMNYTFTYVDGELTISDVLGLTEKIEVRVYPNPVVDYLMISNEQVKSIEIFDLRGSRVLSDKVNGRVDVSQLDIGNYLIQLRDENQKVVFNGRIIKK